MKGNDNVGCFTGLFMIIVIAAVISIVTNKVFLIVVGIIAAVVVVLYILGSHFEKENKKRKEVILSLKNKVDTYISQEPLMEIEEFNEKVSIFDDENGERYEVTYDRICDEADTIKEKQKCTADEIKEIDGLVKQAEAYKNIRRISELMKKDAFLRDADNIEKCIKNKSDLDIVYSRIVDDEDCCKEYGDLAKRVKERADVDFQWAMRDAIDRMKHNCLNQITGKYANSKQHQIAMYEMFVEKIDHYRNIYEEETDEFASKAIRDISHMTGLDYSRNNVVETDDKVMNPIDEIDDMEGIAFENVCADILSYNGFNDIEVTQGSGDQGIDVLAEKDGIKYAIQCKRYSNKLGNTPVQEVHAGKKYYKCQIGVVMTNNYFTKGAIELAEETGTLLWDRDKLIEMMENMSK